MRESQREMREGKSQPSNETFLRVLNSQYLADSLKLVDINIRMSYTSMLRRGKGTQFMKLRKYAQCKPQKKKSGAQQLAWSGWPGSLRIHPPISNILSIRIKESPHLS